MPFDGAAFVLEPLSGSSSTMPPQSWYDRWAAALHQKLRTLFGPPPLPPEMATAVVRLLEDARGLIASPEAWGQRAYETSSGRRCAIGALYRAGQPHYAVAVVWRAHEALLQIALRRGYPTVEMMNDRSTHECVVAAFDEAITAIRGHAALAVSELFRLEKIPVL